MTVAPELIARAAAILRSGGLVAFPTETVYGLGANALDAAAVERIYSAKGRPASSPLIVHVDSIEMAQRLTTSWPDAASSLAAAFWPGPLTIVLPKAAVVPDRVTAGLPTVAIREPNHPVALALIREAGVPIAAPSANRFTELSPTTADHVRESLGDEVDLILDGGSTTVGIESTVISLAGPSPVLLRPGMISRQQLEAIIGRIEIGLTPEAAHSSPGLHPRHYSPRTPLIVVSDGDLPDGRGAWLWLTRRAPAARSVEMPADPHQYGAWLYDTLHALDREGLDWIAVEHPPDTPEWEGIADRLARAMGPRS